MSLVLASILDADHLRLGEEIRRAELAGVDGFSYDVMDGHFVPRIELGPQFVAQLRQLTDLPLEVHLMVEEPQKSIEIFCDAGPDLVSFHWEATAAADELVGYIQGRGLLAGLALELDTDPEELPTELLRRVDHVLLLAVRAGFGGAPPGESTVNRVRLVRNLLDRAGNSTATIEVDGGMKPDNAGTFAAAGADLIAIGTGIFKAPDYGIAINEAQENIRAALGEGSLNRESRLLDRPSLALLDDPARRARLDALREQLDIPRRVWDPLTSRR